MGPRMEMEAVLPAPAARHSGEHWKGVQNTLRQAEAVIAKYENEIEPTAKSALFLHLYAVIEKDPGISADKLDEEFLKMFKLSRLEKEAANPENPLPTIGIEIEFPDIVSYSQKEVLEGVGIHYEIDSPAKRRHEVFEINPGFSYTAEVQARMLQDLISLEIIPQHGDPELPEDEDHPYSLHLNFGFPSEYLLRGQELPREHLLVSDVLTIGFTSKARLDTRQTFVSIQKRPAETSTKNEESMPLGRERSEIRLLEFTGKESFRLLKEAQLLMALANNSFKVKSVKWKGERSFLETKMLTVWNAFELEAKALLEAYGVTGEILDSEESEDRERLAAVADDREAKLAFRDLVQRYAAEAAK